ncbi:MAG: Lrp/AsnC ligand binding domain-containing protein [Pseudomonadota bacterium]
MVEAYVLINCERGQAGNAVKKIKELGGVKQVRLVTGLHDIVALVEGEDLTTLAGTILDKLQKTDGVSRTVTMIAVDL